MNNLKYRNLILLVFVCNMMLGCITLQQPLPGSLLGSWVFVRTGTLDENGNERLSNYRNVCYKESDRLSFTSDKKLSLRWYDESCMINYFLIGKYHVDVGNKILTVDLAANPPHQDSPLPPIKKYRITQMNHDSLKLVELQDNSINRGRVNYGQKPVVYIFMRLDN